MCHPCRTMGSHLDMCYAQKEIWGNVILNVQKLGLCFQKQCWVGYKALTHTVHTVGFFSYIFLCGSHHTQEWRLYSIIVFNRTNLQLYGSSFISEHLNAFHFLISSLKLRVDCVWELCRRKQCWISGSTTNVNHRTLRFSADIATHQANTH